MKTIKTILAVVIALTSTTIANAQTSTGEIHGRIFEKPNEPYMGEVIVWVNVTGDVMKTNIDDEGRFILKPLNAGTYTVYVKVLERNDTIKRTIEVNPNEISKLANLVLSNIELKAHETDVVYVVAEKLISVDQPGVIKMNAKQLKHMPVKRDIKQLIAVMSSDIKTFEGNAYIRGSRADAVLYVIDGVKQSDRVLNMPGAAINNVMVYSSGIPAKYGDCTAGAVIVETKSYFNLYYEWLANH